MNSDQPNREPIIKRCACSREFSRAQWEALPDATVYVCEGQRLEQRRCECGSHIVIVLESASEP